MKGIVQFAMKIEPRCYKCRLPNGKVVDILSDVMVEISQWLQFDKSHPESGGYILGYQHGTTNNITLEFVTTPQKRDIRNRIKCVLRDFIHFKIINSARKNKSYYMGVWHTHPQTVPIPSNTDIQDWNSSLNAEKTGCEYIFFLIAGIEDVRIWVGDFTTKNIIEIFEKSMKEGIYVKE